MTEKDTKRTGITKPAAALLRPRVKRFLARRRLPDAATVYVDIENAQQAREVIEEVLRDWPENLPPVTRLRLYAPAEKTGLWKVWATTQFPGVDVGVRGTQRFTKQSSKNSADLAIVADAIADFTSGLANHVAVVTNDSDFGALFVKLQELTPVGRGTSHPPFLWINVPGSGLSKEIEDFVPERLRWSLTREAEPRHSQVDPVEANGVDLPDCSMIVQWLLEEIPRGRFRAEDVRKVIKRRHPNHPVADSTGRCGAFLARELMPLLENKGVKIVRQSPRTYERTG